MHPLGHLHFVDHLMPCSESDYKSLYTGLWFYFTQHPRVFIYTHADSCHVAHRKTDAAILTWIEVILTTSY